MQQPLKHRQFPNSSCRGTNNKWDDATETCGSRRSRRVSSAIQMGTRTLVNGGSSVKPPSLLTACAETTGILVGAGRFELPTSRTRTVRATKLRYAPSIPLTAAEDVPNGATCQGLASHSGASARLGGQEFLVCRFSSPTSSGTKSNRSPTNV